MDAREQMFKDMVAIAKDLNLLAIFAESSGVATAVADLRQCVGIIQKRVALEREEALCTA